MCSVWDRFDIKTVSFFSGYASRASGMEVELRRIGMEGVIPVWSAPCPYLDVIGRSVALGRHMSTPRIACALKHQQMLRLAYDMGAEHALVMEDDIRFLRDVAAVELCVSSLPDDYDIAFFDWLMQDHAGADGILRQLDAGKRWASLSGEDIRSGGCYACSRRCMERILGMLEGPASSREQLVLNDMLWQYITADSSFVSYCATVHPCAQVVAGGMTNFWSTWRHYRASGRVVMLDYAMP